MRHGKGREADTARGREGMPKDGADLHGNETSEVGGLSTSKHVDEAKKYLDGRNIQGVNIETGWSKKTKFTGCFDEA